MSDQVGNPEDWFSQNEAQIFMIDNSFSLLMENFQNGMTMKFVILLALNDKTNKMISAPMTLASESL